MEDKPHELEKSPIIKKKKQIVVKKVKIVKPEAVHAEPLAISPTSTSDAALSTPITLHQQIIDEVQQQMNEYIYQFNDMELKAMGIARDHLKSSFDMERTIGFQAWCKK